MFHYKLVYTVTVASVDTLCIDSESTWNLNSLASPSPPSHPGRDRDGLVEPESGKYISSRVGSLRARGFLSLEEHEMHALTQQTSTRGYQKNRSLPIEHSSARSYFRKLRMMQDQRSTHLWEYGG